MSNVFVFNPSDFKAAYPQFAKYTDEQLNWFFKVAEHYVDNSEASCFSLEEREIMFFFLVAHLAELQNRIDNGNSGIVGRISSATEGSVSTSIDYNMGSGALEQWLKQTPYGASFYAFAAKYMTALWVAADRNMPINRSRFTYPFSWF